MLGLHHFLLILVIGILSDTANNIKTHAYVIHVIVILCANTYIIKCYLNSVCKHLQRFYINIIYLVW